MTNFENITETAEKLAEFITTISKSDNKPPCDMCIMNGYYIKTCNGWCDYGVQKWLKSEAKE